MHVPKFKLVRPNLLAALLVGLLLAAFPAGRFGLSLYRTHKVKRAREFAALATQDRLAGDLKGSRANLQAALQLSPHDYEVRRASAQMATALGAPDALAQWEHLLSLPEASAEDRIEYVSAALDRNNTAKAAVEMRELYRTLPGDRRVHRLAYQLTSQQTNVDLLVGVARQTAGRFPDDPEAEFALASALLGHPVPSSRSEGRSLLWALVLRDNPWRAAAWESLVINPEVGPTELRLLRRQFAELPTPTLWLRLQDLGAAYRLGDLPGDQIAGHVQALVTGDASDGDWTTIGVWLAQQGAAEAVLQVLPEERAKRTPALAELRFAALIELARLEEAEGWLNRHQGVLRPHLIYAYRGYLEIRRNNPVAAKIQFGSALGACYGRPDLQLAVAQVALAAGQPALVLDTLTALMAWPTLVPELARLTLRAAESIDDVAGQLRVLKRVHDLKPDNSGVLIRIAYLSLLGDQARPELLKDLQAQAAITPDDPFLQVTLALSELRQGSPDAAARRLDALAVRWETMPPGWLAVRVAVLGASGQASAARQVAETIDPNRLRSFERKLIENWLPASTAP